MIHKNRFLSAVMVLQTKCFVLSIQFFEIVSIDVSRFYSYNFMKGFVFNRRK